MAANENELIRFSRFVHRTFNGIDCIYFIKGLRNIYASFGSMEDVIVQGMKASGTIKEGLSYLRLVFFSLPHFFILIISMIGLWSDFTQKLNSRTK